MSSNNTIEKMQFKNISPEDKEWSAHIRLLNKWTEPDRHLRQIIQYARSGTFYPADMHVDLIKQFIQQKVIKARIDELDAVSVSTVNQSAKSGVMFKWVSIEERILELQAQLNHNKKGDSNEQK